MRTLIKITVVFSALVTFVMCNEKPKEEKKSAEEKKYGIYDTPEQLGEHLVTIAGCNDCHTPKKMTPHGPVIDSSLTLSGHPAQMGDYDINRQELEKKGMAATGDLTSWVGPWGISYAANLTPDSTGIGSWKESQFIYAIRNGKFKGLPESRPLLPPMPWEMYRHMTDDELKAVFAYLKSIKPISNIVPAAKPPVSVAKK